MMTISRCRLAIRLVPLALCLTAGCQQKMATQPSYRPDQPSSFFPDGRADRSLVPGTVARGHLRTDAHLYDGSRPAEAFDMISAATLMGAAGGDLRAFTPVAVMATNGENNVVDTFPFPITREVLRHGQERYQIYCVVCHDPLGTGHGRIVERGYTPPPSFHRDRLRQAAVGHFFAVITKGYGSMPAYRDQVPARDRWAIIAYIRALQLSQRFPVNDLPDDLRQAWARNAPSAPPAPAGGNP
jgi:mono/diheme cytochrome c family protein